MKKLIIAAVALTLSGVAYAAGDHNCQGMGNCNTTTNNTTNNIPVANAKATQGQGQLQGQQQGQQQGQIQGQALVNRNDLSNRNTNTNTNMNDNTAISGSSSASVSGARASNDGNKQSVQINTYNPGEIHYSGGYDVRSAPAIAIGGPASGPCNGASGGFGLSVMGGGGMVNFSKVDEGCEERETARMLHMIGKTQDAEALLKSGEVWQRHLKRQQEQQAATKRAEAPAPAAVKTAATPTAPTQTARVKMPADCVSDEYIARRMGAAVCR